MDTDLSEAPLPTTDIEAGDLCLRHAQALGCLIPNAGRTIYFVYRQMGDDILTSYRKTLQALIKPHTPSAPHAQSH